MPPPESLAVLLMSVVLVSVMALVALSMPPPVTAVAELPLSALPATVRRVAHQRGLRDGHGALVVVYSAAKRVHVAVGVVGRVAGERGIVQRDAGNAVKIGR